MRHCSHLLSLNARRTGESPLLWYIILSGERQWQCCLPLHEIKEMYESNVRSFIFSKSKFCDFMHMINCLHVHVLQPQEAASSLNPKRSSDNQEIPHTLFVIRNLVTMLLASHISSLFLARLSHSTTFHRIQLICISILSFFLPCCA
jgi:hypothetical protein